MAADWSHEHYDTHPDLTDPQVLRVLAMAANALRFLADGPSDEQCAEFLASGRSITDAGRWAITRFSAAKRDLTQAHQRVGELEAERRKGTGGAP